MIFHIKNITSASMGTHISCCSFADTWRKDIYILKDIYFWFVIL